MTTTYKCSCGFNIPHTDQCLADNDCLPAWVDPTRYGERDLPHVGTKVRDPNGRAWLVRHVAGAHSITVTNGFGGTARFQANDLRKMPQ